MHFPDEGAGGKCNKEFLGPKICCNKLQLTMSSCAPKDLTAKMLRVERRYSIQQPLGDENLYLLYYPYPNLPKTSYGAIFPKTLKNEASRSGTQKTRTFEYLEL